MLLRLAYLGSLTRPIRRSLTVREDLQVTGHGWGFRPPHLHGLTLYVVRNWAYAIDVFRLNDDGTRGTFVKRITDARFDEPTTAAVHNGRLYVVNARFDADWSDPTTSSTIVSVPL